MNRNALKRTQEFRIYEHDSPKTTKKKQCDCTIYAEGTLPTGAYQRPKTTGERSWDRARESTKAWGEIQNRGTASEVDREYASVT